MSVFGNLSTSEVAINIFLLLQVRCFQLSLCRVPLGMFGSSTFRLHANKPSMNCTYIRKYSYSVQYMQNSGGRVSMSVLSCWGFTCFTFLINPILEDGWTWYDHARLRHTQENIYHAPPLSHWTFLWRTQPHLICWKKKRKKTHFPTDKALSSWITKQYSSQPRIF